MKDSTNTPRIIFNGYSNTIKIARLEGNKKLEMELILANDTATKLIEKFGKMAPAVFDEKIKTVLDGPAYPDMDREIQFLNLAKEIAEEDIYMDGIGN